MTRKLYDLNPYDTEFVGVVEDCFADKDMFCVVLDQTLFFPEEGGQSCDKGTINGIEVLQVKIKNDIVYHYIPVEMAKGTAVAGKIDFTHRFYNMQMHSGEHIFTGLIHNKYGFNNVGFHLSDNSATMDYDGKLSAEELSELEYMANRIIVENRDIKAYYPDRDELNNLQYRSKKELEGPVRIVIVDGVDICACCAPHVRKTGEIGIFKIVSFENYKGGIRVHYLCGFRALQHYDNRINELKKISNLLTVKEFSEADAVMKLNDELRNVKYENVSLSNKLLKQRILAGAEAGNIQVFVGDESDVSGLKYAMEVLHEICDGVCAVFAGNSEIGFRYLIEHKGGDLSSVNEILHNKYNAKGGGRKDSLQGTVFIDKDEIKLLFEAE